MPDLTGEPDDGFLHVWECAWLLRPEMEKRCGFISRSPGVCPYDHAEEVDMIEITATVHCSDCSVPIERNDCRANDGRLICSECVLTETATKCPDCVDGHTHDVLDGEPVVEVCGTCHGSALAGDDERTTDA